MKLNIPTKLSFLAVLLFALLGSRMYMGNAIAVGAGNAESQSSRLTELPIVEFVGLGDDQPFWETTVHIEQNQLSRSRYAALEFVVVGVWEGTSSNLIVNGREYVLPASEPLGIMDIPLRGRSVIPIPVGVLQAGDNTIAIQSGPINNPINPYDDFDVAYLTLVLGH